MLLTHRLLLQQDALGKVLIGSGLPRQLFFVESIYDVAIRVPLDLLQNDSFILGALSACNW